MDYFENYPFPLPPPEPTLLIRCCRCDRRQAVPKHLFQEVRYSITCPCGGLMVEKDDIVIKTIASRSSSAPDWDRWITVSNTTVTWGGRVVFHHSRPDLIDEGKK